MNKKRIYQYLNIDNSDEKLELLIDECIKEVKEIADFKVIYDTFHISHNPLKIIEYDLIIESCDLSFYFQDCHECMIIAGTLGALIDRRIKYYEHIDMYKAYVFDQVCNSYLEECLDEFSQSLPFVHTYRFAPGYGDLPLSLNNDLYHYMNLNKYLNISLNHGLFIPLKTIVGICGIGKTSKKSCMSCSKIMDCVYRKEGRVCYVID